MACKSCSKSGKYKRYNTIQKIKSLSSAVKDMFSGEYVPQLKRVERLNICQGCDEYETKNKTCSICTCFINEKIKYVNQKCDLNKW